MAVAFNAYKAILENPVFDSLELQSLETEDLRELGLVRKRYGPRTNISHDFGTDERSFLIDSGWGCIAKVLPDGERQIVDFMLPGDMVGFRDRKTANSSFAAMTELTCYEVNKRALLSTITRSERFSKIFFAVNSRQKAILAEHLTNLGRRGALVRTGHLLLELGARLENTGQADGSGFQCPLTQYDLADALGLTAIHVNRMLRMLREQDLLSFQKGNVEFIDHLKLIKLTDFDRSYLG